MSFAWYLSYVRCWSAYIFVQLTYFDGLWLEIDRYGFIEADTDISKIFKSCFLLCYQKYGVFCAVPFFKNLKNQDL